MNNKITIDELLRISKSCSHKHYCEYCKFNIYGEKCEKALKNTLQNTLNMQLDLARKRKTYERNDSTNGAIK